MYYTAVPLVISVQMKWVNVSPFVSYNIVCDVVKGFP